MILIYVQSILPVNKIGVKRFKQVNQQSIEINEEFFIDTNAELDKQYTQDGIHLTGKGYLLWLEVIDKFYLWI